MAIFVNFTAECVAVNVNVRLFRMLGAAGEDNQWAYLDCNFFLFNQQ